MSIIDTIINKALEFEGITEKPAGSNNVQFNTHYYGHEVEDGKPNEDDAYPWCVTYLWDVFRLCGASNIFCDGLKTASTETVYDTYNNGRLFSTGQAGDFILIKLLPPAAAGV